MLAFFLLSFLVIFGIFIFCRKRKESVFTSLRLSFIKASLILSLLMVTFTESLSFFKVLNFNFISLLWIITFLVSLTILIFLTKKNKFSLKSVKFNKIADYLKKETLIIKVTLSLGLVVLITLFCVDFTFNTNWDSYTYHLPRVEHWIQDKNVDFFPTNNIRQLYLAPFSEYAILNLRLLSGNALFLNFVQFFALINCSLLASLIAKSFGLLRRGQIMAFVLALTIPMGILQAQTTQTDLVVSFFLISFVYFGISVIQKKELSVSNILFLCLSFSFGILTKSTFYIFTLPFCLIFGIYYLKLFRFKAFLILLFIIPIFLLTNSSFLIREYRQFGSFLGPQKSSPYYLPSLNEEFGVKETLSNSVKNIGLHLALPNDTWNIKIDQMVTRFHEIIKFPLNSDKTSWFKMPYKTSFTLHHDVVGNFLHTILFFVALFFVFVRFRSTPKLVLHYSLAIIFGFLFFVFLLKWQPWQTRLDLPMFFCMTPFIAYGFSLVKWKQVNSFVSLTLLFIILGIIFFFDPTKPVLGKNSVFFRDNNSYIFGYSTAKEIELKLNQNKIFNIGLAIGGDSLEWQYWLLLKNRRFEYIYFYKDLVKTSNFDNSFRYRASIIDNNYLLNPQINDLIKDKDDILEISNIDEKTTLVIYKGEQDRIITY